MSDDMRLVGRWVLTETDDTEMRRFEEVWMELFGDGRLVFCADYGPQVGCSEFIYRIEDGELVAEEAEDDDEDGQRDIRRASYEFTSDGDLRLDHGKTYSLFRKGALGAGPV